MYSRTKLVTKMKTYKPIDCSYHDYLLELATFKKMIAIVYLENDVRQEITTRIVDVYTKKGEEFLVTESDLTIRLDQLISVNNKLNSHESCSI